MIWTIVVVCFNLAAGVPDTCAGVTDLNRNTEYESEEICLERAKSLARAVHDSKGYETGYTCVENSPREKYEPKKLN